jgi:hypothetical protein
MNEWREGARQGDSNDSCPGCGLVGVLTMDFSKFGKRKVRICPTCQAVFEGEKKVSSITYTKETT